MINMRKIKSIECITSQGIGHRITEGDTINDLIVAKILDRSLQTQVDMYICYVAVDEHGNLIREYINCPIIVDYYEIDETKEAKWVTLDD
jgi:hypothetical protein